MPYGYHRQSKEDRVLGKLDGVRLKVKDCPVEKCPYCGEEVRLTYPNGGRVGLWVDAEMRTWLKLEIQAAASYLLGVTADGNTVWGSVLEKKKKGAKLCYLPHHTSCVREMPV
jgi:hypothetical protein